MQRRRLTGFARGFTRTLGTARPALAAGIQISQRAGERKTLGVAATSNPLGARPLNACHEMTVCTFTTDPRSAIAG